MSWIALRAFCSGGLRWMSGGVSLRISSGRRMIGAPALGGAVLQEHHLPTPGLHFHRGIEDGIQAVMAILGPHPDLPLRHARGLREVFPDGKTQFPRPVGGEQQEERDAIRFPVLESCHDALQGCHAASRSTKLRGQTRDDAHGIRGVPPHGIRPYFLPELGVEAETARPPHDHRAPDGPSARNRALTSLTRSARGQHERGDQHDIDGLIRDPSHQLLAAHDAIVLDGIPRRPQHEMDDPLPQQMRVLEHGDGNTRLLIPSISPRAE